MHGREIRDEDMDELWIAGAYRSAPVAVLPSTCASCLYSSTWSMPMTRALATTAGSGVKVDARWPRRYSAKADGEQGGCRRGSRASGQHGRPSSSSARSESAADPQTSRLTMSVREGHARTIPMRGAWPVPRRPVFAGRILNRGHDAPWILQLKRVWSTCTMAYITVGGGIASRELAQVMDNRGRGRSGRGDPHRLAPLLGVVACSMTDVLQDVTLPQFRILVLRAASVNSASERSLLE